MMSVFNFNTISTHALTEGDVILDTSLIVSAHFNSRPHGGRRAPPHIRIHAADVISTHALTEGDRQSAGY